jgi:hypothetical protein
MSKKNNAKRNRERNRRERQLAEAVRDPNPLKFTFTNDAPMSQPTPQDSNEELVQRFKEIQGQDYYKRNLSRDSPTLKDT